jgi:hypothetical protein
MMTGRHEVNSFGDEFYVFSRKGIRKFHLRVRKAWIHRFLVAAPTNGCAVAGCSNPI